jgi:hypothetical protein
MAENQTPYSLSPTLVEQFASGWLADSSLAALSIRSGQQLDLSEIIALCASAKSLYELVTLLCRQQSRIATCAALWQEAQSVFNSAAQTWQDVLTLRPTIARAIGVACARQNYAYSSIDRYCCAF